MARFGVTELTAPYFGDCGKGAEVRPEDRENRPPHHLVYIYEGAARRAGCDNWCGFKVRNVVTEMIGQEGA